ncbi:tripartite tricarboxylate transporter TctB family protein [Blastococcus sp. HT6-30]|uniref:tripartite tricarboxylate transporter TctB family protein n=1 Tax=Blastococcus sp. HT6-30 TaxID=3144843 RepID=UPI0032196DFE
MLILVAVAVYALTLDFPAPDSGDPGVAVLPRAAAVFLGLCAIPLLLRPEPGSPLPRGAAAWRVLASVGLLLAYIAALEPVGFTLSTAVFLLLQGLILARSHIVALSVSAVVVAFGLYYLFRELLGVPLPRSPWFGGFL